jgi:dolichol-phosphate mannosyltransferase
MYKNKKIILIVPVFNEEDKIGEVVKKAKGTVIDEICVVDDGSNDKSPKNAKNLGATVLSHEKRMGIGSAIRTGIKHALEKNFDIIVVCAGNNKDNPKEVETLLRPIIEQGYDYIQGSRYLKGGKWGNTPFYRIVFSQIFSLFFSLLVGKRFTDVTNGFRAYTADFVKNKNINLDQEWLNGYELEYYLHYRAISEGFKVKEVPVSKIYPTKKTSKIRPFIDWIHIVKPVILLKLRIRK